MAAEIPENKVSIQVEFDPKKLTPERLKQITDQVVARIAEAASGTRDIGGGHTSHSQGHWK